MKPATTKPTALAFHTAALTGLLALTFLPSANAADFTGSLKGVTITDAQATNKAPIASFIYTQNGQVITLNAGGSSDPDGSITKYKWDFGNGKVAEGATATYTVTDANNLNITLTVVDNNNGVALSQQTVAPVSAGIRDDFSTNTASKYTIMSGKGLSVSGGALHTSANQTTVAYYNNSLGSNDHVIEADVKYAPEFGGGVLVRCNPQQKTGYLVFFESGRVSLNTYTNGTVKYLSFYDGKYKAGTYRLKVSVLGSTISVAVNGAVVLTKTDSSFATGTYAGIRLRAGADAAAISLDNLVGK